MRKLHLSPSVKRWVIISLAAAVGLYAVATVGAWALYKQHYFPRSTFNNKNVGGQTFTLQKLNVPLPSQLSFAIQGITVDGSPANVGLSPDPSAALVNLQRERHFSVVYLSHFFRRHTYGLGIHIDNAAFSTFVNEHLRPHEQKPVDAHLTVEKEQVIVSSETSGQVVDSAKLQSLIRSTLAQNHTTFSVPLMKTTGARPTADLQKAADARNAALGQAVKIIYTGGSYEPTRAEKAGWLSPTGNSLVFDKTKIPSFLDGLQKRFGKTWDNSVAVAAQISDKLNSGAGLEVIMHDKPIALRTYRYCVALRDVGEDHRAEFEAKLRSVYADSRGWGLNGKIVFTQVASGCNFTVWLSAAADVPSFGPSICDNYYSCTVSPNVIINFDRWQGATDPWNAAGGSLDDYHAMVINHETGHWLGFGHQNCPGAGQLAPVMQQQSVSLQGCKFNPWPLPGELANLGTIKAL